MLELLKTDKLTFHNTVVNIIERIKMKHYNFLIFILFSFSSWAMDVNNPQDKRKLISKHLQGPKSKKIKRNFSFNKEEELKKVRVHPKRDIVLDVGLHSFGLFLTSLMIFGSYTQGIHPLPVIVGGLSSLFLVPQPIFNKIIGYCDRESGMKPIYTSFPKDNLHKLIKKYKKIIPKKQQNIGLISRLENYKSYYFQQLCEVEALKCLPIEILDNIAEKAGKEVNSHDIYKLVQQLFYSSKIREINRETLKLKYNGHEALIKDESLEAWLYHLKKPGASKELPRYNVYK